MSDRTNHRRVLCFAVTGVLLGGPGCTSNETPKVDAKTNERAKEGGLPEPEKPPEPELEFAPNPGPNERNGVPAPDIAPTTAVKEPLPPPDQSPVEDHVNEGPMKEPPKAPEPKAPEPKAAPEKRVNTGPVKEPVKPIIKSNPGPEP